MNDKNEFELPKRVDGMPQNIEAIPNNIEINSNINHHNINDLSITEEQINNKIEEPVFPTPAGEVVETINMEPDSNVGNVSESPFEPLSEITTMEINQEVSEPITNPLPTPEVVSNFEQNVQPIIEQISNPDVISSPEQNVQPIIEPISTADVASNVEQNVQDINQQVQQTVEPVTTLETAGIGTLNIVEDNQNVPITPQNNDPILNTNTEINSNIPTEPLNKKVVVEKPVKKEKSNGNLIVGFLAILLILAIIVVSFYYFVKMDYIKLPDDIKGKIPFMGTTTTTTTAPIKNNENIDDNENNILETFTVNGNYLEVEPIVCNDVGTELILNDDETFTYTKLNFNEEMNECNKTEINGTYIARDGILKLVSLENPEEVINANYNKIDTTVQISIPLEDGRHIILNSTLVG